ncbi:MAG: 50S ribosomal protein L13 [Nitrospirae bacterium]|nr:MAG: 50S ribosomal protein L13 [Nitrospirota bacterium]
MKTVFFRKKDVERRWFLIDAEGKRLGRLATKIATVLRGKHKPTYTPNADVGDFVVVINASKVHLTGKKIRQKTYYHHTGYPGGIKEISAYELLKNKPEKMLMHAVKGMLPKNRLGRAQFKKLKVYSGPNHPHAAQKPKPINIENLYEEL